jgi:hypothetical protein
MKCFDAHILMLYLFKGFLNVRDHHLEKLTTLLQKTTCNIWGLNVGELALSRETWESFATGLSKTMVTNLFAPEEKIGGILKKTMMDSIRRNRTKHQMWCNGDLDFVSQFDKFWWNPSQSTRVKKRKQNRHEPQPQCRSKRVAVTQPPPRPAPMPREPMRRRSKRKKKNLSSRRNQCLSNALEVVCHDPCKTCKRRFKHETGWVYKKESPIQGYGLFANRDIPKNTFLIRYRGEQVTIKNNGRRSKKEYMIRLRGNVFLDAQRHPGIHKFANHCCNGSYQRSARLHPWSDEKGIDRISLVTDRKVQRGDEILVDYGSDYEIEPCKCPNCIA